MKLTQTNEDILAYGEKYHFHHNEDNRSIVCTTAYKGQTVRGIAKCSPEDAFDIETGKKLAYLRCKQKFAAKKFKRAYDAYLTSMHEEIKMRDRRRGAYEFLSDSEFQLDRADSELEAFEANLNA